MQIDATKLVAAKEIELQKAETAETLQDGWVRLRLASAGVCGTDTHYFQHFGNAGFPLKHAITLGHEACAYVEDANGTDLTEGALVAVNPIIKCGTCDFCLAGEENHCSNKRFPGSALTVPHIDGFFQDVFDFPAACCYPAPSHVDAKHLAFAEPLACSLHAVEVGAVQEGSRVLVLGCGPMGLLSVVAAVARGAHVTCADVREEAVAKGVEIGAHVGLVIGQGKPGPDDNSYDCVIEASGAIAALNSAFEAVKRCGYISVLSNIRVESGTANLHKIMLKEIKLVGSFQFNCEFKEAVDIIASGKFDFGALIAKRFPLSEVKDAFDLALSGKAVGKVQFAGAS